MKILQINTVYSQGSTGSIVKAIHDLCKDNEIECFSACRWLPQEAKTEEDAIEISSKWDSRIHLLISRFTMFKGIGSFGRTVLFLRKVNAYNPDLIHLHNLHGSYINLPLLFKYIECHNVPVIWTLHDCWAFTAICSHFSLNGCGKWKDGCYRCQQKKQYSSSPLDLTRVVWKYKKTLFTSMPKAVIVTPSKWLNNVARESFLKTYEIQTIYNGIDLKIFDKTASDFRTIHELDGKKVILGVAFNWSHAKGLDVFVELSKRLPENYKIVLVGTTQKTVDLIPDSIISIHRTADRHELAAIYTAADVFVNPTREEVFGLVNIEALACSTPVVTFNTGGSPESITPECGVVVPQDDIDAMESAIIHVCADPSYQENCRKRALQFDDKNCLKKYLDLYHKVIKASVEDIK